MWEMKNKKKKTKKKVGFFFFFFALSLFLGILKRICLNRYHLYLF